jgi:hypothetical protein
MIHHDNLAYFQRVTRSPIREIECDSFFKALKVVSRQIANTEKTKSELLIESPLTS